MVAVILWSTTVAVARSLTEELGPRTSVAAVFLTGALTLGARARWARIPLLDLRGCSRRYLLGCGTLFVFYMFALFQSLALATDRTEVLELGMVNYLWPGLTLLLSVPLAGARANGLLIPGTVVALTGEFLVLTHRGVFAWATATRHVIVNPVAYGLALAAAVSWALYSALTRRWSTRAGNGAVFPFMAATALVMLCWRMVDPEPGSWTARSVAEVLFLGAATAIAYACWDLAMRRGNIALTAAGSYFTPLLSTLVSCVYLDIAPGSRLWVGAIVLVAGSLLSWRGVSPRRAGTN